MNDEMDDLRQIFTNLLSANGWSDGQTVRRALLRIAFLPLSETAKTTLFLYAAP